MAEREIIQTGAQVLRARAAEVSEAEIATKEFAELVSDMVEAMRAAPGVGLAAPQIGVGKRVIVLEDRADFISRLTPAETRERERAPLPLRVIVNPTMEIVNDENVTFFEGCLSVMPFVALVPRAREVIVKGLSEHGDPVNLHAAGWAARILQHELDHLDGVLYIDRMLSRSFATQTQASALYGGKPIAEIREMLGV